MTLCKVPIGNKQCGNVAVGRTTLEWLIPCCREHFPLLRNNGFQPRTWEDIATTRRILAEMHHA